MEGERARDSAPSTPVWAQEGWDQLEELAMGRAWHAGSPLSCWEDRNGWGPGLMPYTRCPNGTNNFLATFILTKAQYLSVAGLQASAMEDIQRCDAVRPAEASH